MVENHCASLLSPSGLRLVGLGFTADMPQALESAPRRREDKGQPEEEERPRGQHQHGQQSSPHWSPSPSPYWIRRRAREVATAAVDSRLLCRVLAEKQA